MSNTTLSRVLNWAFAIVSAGIFYLLKDAYGWGIGLTCLAALTVVGIGQWVDGRFLR